MGPNELRSAYEAELRVATRTTAIVAGVVALVAFPAWAVFDSIVVPAEADEFLVVRVAFQIPIAVGWALLLSPRIGKRWAEPLALALVGLVELAISWMVPRTGDRLAPYLLGQSLAIYACAFLVIWRWQLTAMVVAFTLAVTVAFGLTADPGPEDHQWATIAFYLATAGTLAIAASVYRDRTGFQRFVAQANLEEEQRRNAALVEELDRLSREDALTGVGNRRAWEERIVNELLRANRSGGTVSVIICDLDRFKSVNDSLGHAAGDRVLRAAAALLTGRVRATDFVARLGGDEFCVLCPDTGLREAEALALELVVLARAAEWPEGVSMTLSVGVAEARPGQVDPADVLHRADHALYEAKATRDTVRHA